MHSLAYHGDDGHIFHGSGVSSAQFGPIFSAGDTVGCGIHLAHRRVFFTLNGEFIGSPFALPTLGRPSCPLELFAAVGIDTHRRLALNFGLAPFKFDPERAEEKIGHASMSAAASHLGRSRILIPAFISGSELQAEAIDLVDSDDEDDEYDGEEYDEYDLMGDFSDDELLWQFGAEDESDEEIIDLVDDDDDPDPAEPHSGA